MRLTASFYINKHLFQELYDKSYISNNLYNQANWIINDIYKNEGRYINYFELDKYIKTNFRNTEYNNYYKLGGALSQQILRLLDKNWKSFFKSLKDLKKNPSKYKGIPKPPKYKKKNSCN